MVSFSISTVVKYWVVIHIVEQVVREYDFTEGGEIADEPVVVVGRQK